MAPLRGLPGQGRARMKSHVYFSLSVWRTWRRRRAGPVSVWRGWLADGVLGVPALSPARSEGGNFWPGLLVGGVVGGALAYIFAPQISRYLLGEEAQASGEGAVEETNTKLGAEIAALNSEIDKVKEKVREARERGWHVARGWLWGPGVVAREAGQGALR